MRLIDFLGLPEMEASLAKHGPRGGRRDGAGRKPLEGGRVTAAFVLRQDQVDWLDAQAIELGVSKSEIVRALIGPRHLKCLVVMLRQG